MKPLWMLGLLVAAGFLARVEPLTRVEPQGRDVQVGLGRLDVNPPPIASDRSVNYDYDIVYVRVPRDVERKMMFAEANFPVSMTPGGDLMLLHPDGREEVLVQGGADGSIVDAFVSFDGTSVYYAHLRGIRELRASSSDIYKINLRTRQTVRLTKQEFTPNTAIV